MKVNIEDYLHQIDASFKNKSQKDIYMTYVMIFAAIFAFAYLLYWEKSVAEFEAKMLQITSVKSKILKDQNYLKYNTEAKINQIKQSIEVTRKSTLAYKKNNAYVKKKIEAISSLIYDEQAWGEYLHSISKNAKLNNIKLLSFSNQFAKENKSFGHVLDIEISSVGSYKNTLKFINSLEESNLVIDLHDIDMDAKEKLTTDLKISVWGIRYQ